MKISANVSNSHNTHEVVLKTNDTTHSITIPSKSSGYGSAANGGELLLLALATCYCNDIYREAAKRGIAVTQVDVNVEAEFGAEGEAARTIHYHANVISDADPEDVEDLIRYTDTVAEIQNTLRKGIAVTLALDAR